MGVTTLEKSDEPMDDLVDLTNLGGTKLDDLLRYKATIEKAIADSIEKDKKAALDDIKERVDKHNITLAEIQSYCGLKKTRSREKSASKEGQKPASKRATGKKSGTDNQAG